MDVVIFLILFLSLKSLVTVQTIYTKELLIRHFLRYLTTASSSTGVFKDLKSLLKKKKDH